jgi:competence protein ComEA
MLKNLLTGYLSFTRKERTGIFVLLTVTVGVVALPFLYPFFVKRSVVATERPNELAALQLQRADSQYQGRYGYDRKAQPQRWQRRQATQPAGELFYFDPNTATAEDWQRLGLREKTVATIQNYRAKGGRFYRPDDIGKIWGLHPDEVERLLPYVRIAEKGKPADGKAYHNPFLDKKEAAYERKPALVDINQSDTAALMALPGIGPKLAGRIVAFRGKLGGFYSVAQVGETYGLPDSVFQRIKGRLALGQGPVAQLNINNATLEQLKQHPYIRYALANAIVRYRQQHGPFAQVADLQKIMLVTDELYQKLVPYVTVE